MEQPSLEGSPVQAIVRGESVLALSEADESGAERLVVGLRERKVDGEEGAEGSKESSEVGFGAGEGEVAQEEAGGGEDLFGGLEGNEDPCSA